MKPPPAEPGVPRSLTGPWLLTVRQVAGLLAISVRGVWSLLATERLRAVRIGRRTTRIDARDVERFIETATSGKDK